MSISSTDQKPNVTRRTYQRPRVRSEQLVGTVLGCTGIATGCSGTRRCCNPNGHPNGGGCC